jgi:hypothetical protein
MAFPFLQRSSPAEARQVQLAMYTPVLALEGLTAGVDNVRHDVFLSPKFSEQARQHIARLIAKYGAVEDLVRADSVGQFRPPSVVTAHSKGVEPGDFKKVLADLHVAALSRAKSERNLSLDLLARVAILKFLRAEMNLQFANTLERCRAKLKSFEGPRQGDSPRAIELRERAAGFQLAKKTILRRVGQDLFQTLREIEKETLLRMRRSLLGETASTASYELFLNRLVFTEDGRDDYLNAEQYVMLGNYSSDPDRLTEILAILSRFLQSLNLSIEESQFEAVLTAPENAQALVAGGTPDEATGEGKLQKAILAAWLEALERAGVMDYVIASYEAVPLLAEYASINPQQLKNALVSRAERKRVEGLLEEQRKVSSQNFLAAVRRVDACRGGERAKVAGRFLGDLMRYYRDLRRLDVLTQTMDSVNVITSDKIRELSAINSTLYEFLLPEEQKPAEDKVVHHIIMKADIRDSTTLTRTLFERGLNPASYFSLNFYEPVNKLLPKYDAGKVFIEGDAVILALFEREGEPGFGVGRACVLAKEMIQIVYAYNEQSRASGLPILELGIGICYQDSAPMYLMDGKSRIMISKALNESDRLSSCSKPARRLAANVGVFNVYTFQAIEEDGAGYGDEFLVRYNIGGICLNQAAFKKLQSEISLQVVDAEMPNLLTEAKVRLYHGVVPVGPGMFHKIVVREARMPHINPRDFAIKHWTENMYYEVCTNQAVYDHLG